MDIVSDALFDGRPIRILAAITREAPSIAPRANFRPFDVVAELDRLAREQGRPKTLKVDNGPEFAGRMLDQWAHLNGRSTSLAPGSPRTTPISRRSTAASGQSASTPPGSCPWPMRGTGSTAPWVTAELDPAGVRRAGSTSPTSCVALGPDTGSGPMPWPTKISAGPLDGG